MAGYQQVNTLNDLSNFSKVPLALTGDALASVDRGNQADQSNLADLFSQNQHMQNMRPMQEQQQDLSNQGLQAGLPGIVANSAIAQRNNSNAEILTPEVLAAAHSKHTKEENQNVVDRMHNLGQTMQQASAIIRTNPINGIPIAKRMFQQAGHGDMWNNDWENIQGNGGLGVANELETTGKKIQESGDRFSQALGTQQLKVDSARALQESRLQATMDQVRARITSAEKIHQETMANKKELSKETAQQAAERYNRLADEAEQQKQPEEAAGYRAKADQHIRIAGWLAAQSAATGNESKLDMEHLQKTGQLKTISSARTQVNEPPSVKPPAPAASTSAGTILMLHPNGTTKGYVPADKVVQALKDGYTTIGK